MEIFFESFTPIVTSAHRHSVFKAQIFPSTKRGKGYGHKNVFGSAAKILAREQKGGGDRVIVIGQTSLSGFDCLTQPRS